MLSAMCVTLGDALPVRSPGSRPFRSGATALAGGGHSALMFGQDR